MTTPGYDYDKAIPAGFYDEIYQRRAGVRFFWHDLKFRAVAARLDGRRLCPRHRLRPRHLHRQLSGRRRLPGHRLQRSLDGPLFRAWNDAAKAGAVVTQPIDGRRPYSVLSCKT
jgi:hypothetical protein